MAFPKGQAGYWRGKKRPEQLGEKNPFFGKRHSEETKRKNREWHEGRITFFKKGHAGYWKGKHLPVEMKEKISVTNTGHGCSEETHQKIREKRLLQVLPTKNTSIERAIQAELEVRGIGCYRHYPVIGQPDFAFPEKKIAVFADGDYWHSTPRAKETDPRVNAALREEGWLVLRYSETEIKANPIEVVDKITGALYG